MLMTLGRKRAGRPGSSRAQSRKASFPTESRDSPPAKGPFPYYVGVVTRLPRRAPNGNIEVKTADWVAAHLKKNKGVLCQAIDVHAPTQLRLRDRFPDGLFFHEMDIRSLNQHILPKMAEGDIVLFQMTSEEEARARHVIDVTAKAYLQ